MSAVITLQVDGSPVVVEVGRACPLSGHPTLPALWQDAASEPPSCSRCAAGLSRHICMPDNAVASMCCALDVNLTLAP